MTETTTAQAGTQPESAGSATASAHAEGQQHPIGIYLKVWGWLFFLSILSYLVEIADFDGLLRWGLVSLFMLLKAGLIVSVFMHMLWERLALTYAILLPVLAVLVFVLLMAMEGGYIEIMRLTFFENAI